MSHRYPVLLYIHVNSAFYGGIEGNSTNSEWCHCNCEGTGGMFIMDMDVHPFFDQQATNSHVGLWNRTFFFFFLSTAAGFR